MFLQLCVRNFRTLNNLDMKIKLPLFFLFTIISFTLTAQLPDSVKPRINKNERSISLLTAFAQGKYSFIDIGISVNNDFSDGHHPASNAYFFSSEIKLGNKIIIGPKIGGWVAGGSAAMALGA